MAESDTSIVVDLISSLLWLLSDLPLTYDERSGEREYGVISS